MKCNKCNNEIPDNSKFCLHCGAKVEVIDGVVCPKCRYRNPLDATFCTECGNSLQSLLQHLNDLDASKYNFLQFRGVQIYGTVDSVEEKLYSLGYKKKNGLLVGTYAGYKDCTIEIRITGPTKHVNELLIVLPYSCDANTAKQKFIEAMRTKYQIDGREVRHGITFDTPYGTFNIHRDNTDHFIRLKIRIRGLDDVYKQYDIDKHNKEISDFIHAL